LSFADTSSVLDLNADGNAAKTVTVDPADINFVATVTGETTANIVTTLRVNTTDDFTAFTPTDVDTVVMVGTAADQNLILDGADFGANQYTTVTGSGDDNLTLGTGVDSDLSNATISGFDTIDASAVAGNNLTIGANISGTVTVIGAAATDLTIAETGDYTNLSITAGDFDNLTLTGGITATVDEATLAGAFTSIDSDNATDANLTINMVGTTFSLAGIGIGQTFDVDTTITGTAGNDIITAADNKSAGSAMTIDSGTGTDQVRLDNESGNAGDLMVLADAVSISNHDASNDQVAIEGGSVTFNSVATKTTGAVNQTTDGFVFISNGTVNDFTNITQVGAAIGTLAGMAAGEEMVYAIPNNTGTQVGIYYVMEDGTAVLTVDAADTVTLVAVVTVTNGTFDVSDIAIY